MHRDVSTDSARSAAVPTDALQRIGDWARELGFQEIGVADTDLSDAEAGLLNWLDAGSHGAMDYMARHGLKRARPHELVPGTLRILSVRMNYLPPHAADPQSVLNRDDLGYVSRYALGRDYHKVLRTRLQQLIERMRAAFGEYAFRAYTDSAPVLEVALAAKAGLGWRGKHTLLLNRSAGSYFFLGEIYTDLPLPVSAPTSDHCGSCERCIAACPTGAILAPYKLDARRCISYLTIEHPGSVPEALRPAFGNRIYGCDDCQLACPWNKYAQVSEESDFAVRNGLDGARLAELFAWTAAEFEARLAGSAIRRIGHERWLRNIAIALGNAPTSGEIVAALRSRLGSASALVREHVEWALSRHTAGDAPAGSDAGAAERDAGGAAVGAAGSGN